ncbi:uncharacterized protein [Henckelia pumila]|uniref:uncharacterized protein n=1 Tax=Henckelia pumila TaxID=405737 RepID=UPI003C6E49D3
MKDNEEIRTFISRVVEIINQIKSYGDTIEDKKIVEKVLRSLPQKFEHVVAAIEESKDLSKFMMVELMGSLEAHEKRMIKFLGPSIEQAFEPKLKIAEKKKYEGGESSTSQQFQQRGGFKNYQYRGRGRGKPRFNNNQRGSGNINSNSFCFVCKKLGHESKNCWDRCKTCKIPNHSYKDCWHRQKNEGNEANFTEENDQKIMFYSCMNMTNNSLNMWYLDSGCSNHMKGHKDYFIKFDENFSSEVKMGDGKMQPVQGKGTVAVRTKGVNFEKNECKIRDKDKKLIAEIKMSPNKDDVGVLFGAKIRSFCSICRFKKMVERESNLQLKTLRIDRGGEFLSKEFSNYCSQEGIRRQLTARYTPQQNGVAERKNRIIVEMARSMLKAKGLPNTFWAEAVNTVVYILNKSPTKANPSKTSYEAWHKRKPEIKHL